MTIRLTSLLTLAVIVPVLAEAQQPPGQPPGAQQAPLAQQVNPAVRRTMAAGRMEAQEAIRLDGIFDEAVWSWVTAWTSSRTSSALPRRFRAVVMRA